MREIQIDLSIDTCAHPMFAAVSSRFRCPPHDSADKVHQDSSVRLWDCHAFSHEIVQSWCLGAEDYDGSGGCLSDGNRGAEGCRQTSCWGVSAVKGEPRWIQPTDDSLT